MGFKTSMVLIEKGPTSHRNDERLLRSLGITGFEKVETTTFEQCMNITDGTVAIGEFNNNFIICDGNRATDSVFRDDMSDSEKFLAKNYPESEVIHVACHSGNNYHGYSVIQNGEKVRYKAISADDKVREWGNPLPEEEEIYSRATMTEGGRVWRNGADDMLEDQLMEDFTFDVARRRLGVRVDSGRSDELMAVPMTRYRVRSTPSERSKPHRQKEGKSGGSNIGIWTVVGVVLILLRIILRMIRD